MGVIAKQSGCAAIALGAGMVIGALNNLVVLPRAFDGNEAIWGLVRIMTSWGMICASISTLGAPGSIVRFLHRYEEGEREKSLNSILGIGAFGVLSTLAILWKWGERWIVWLDPDKGELLAQNVHWFLVIVAIAGVLHIFRALLVETPDGVHRVGRELWQKTSCLSSAPCCCLIGFRSTPRAPCTSPHTASLSC